MSWRPVPARKQCRHCSVTKAEAAAQHGNRAVPLKLEIAGAGHMAIFVFVFRGGFLHGFGKTCRNPVLVGGFNLPLWKMMEWVTVGMMTGQNMMGKIIHSCSGHHQSAILWVSASHSLNPTSTYINGDVITSLLPMLGWWPCGIPQWSYDRTTGCPWAVLGQLSESVSYHLEILKTWGFSMVFLPMFPFNQSWHVLRVEFLKDWMGPYSWPGIEDYRKKPERIRIPHIWMPLVKDHGHQNTHVGDNNYQQSTYRLPLFSYTLQTAQAWLIYHQSWMTTWCLITLFSLSFETAVLEYMDWWQHVRWIGSCKLVNKDLTDSTPGDRKHWRPNDLCQECFFCVQHGVHIFFSSSSPSSFSSCSCWWWWRRCWWKRSWKPAPD